MASMPQARELAETGSPHFYTLTDLERRWQTSYRNLFRKVQERKLRAIRLGSLIRVSAEEVERVERDGF